MTDGPRQSDPASGVKRLLIYRMGSLGDTVVALPVFRLLARRFAGAERRVLTNLPVNSDAAPIQTVLGDTGLVHGYFPYPARMRSARRIAALRGQIADWAPDLAVYFTQRRGLALWRDVLFLRLCGVRRIACVPTTADLQRHRGPDANGLWESEASRLARCAAELGDAGIDDPANWSLAPTAAETAAATEALAGWPGALRFAAFSIGAKIAVKSWGDDRWASLLGALSARHAGLGLALIGGPNDAARSAAVARGWQGPVLNLCGQVPPRVSALVIGRAALYMGHDSGPMHLAASTGTPAVCVFGNHVKPGIWFPFGSQHRIFYPGLSWSGGEPPALRDAAGETNITLVPVAPVLEACDAALRAAPAANAAAGQR